MSRQQSVPRRRRNLMAADPHCHWCGIEVREYPQDNDYHDDRATIDHLNDLSAGRPRPPEGETVLACNKCNSRRGRESMEAARELLPCQECARACLGRFCGGKCFAVNMTRLGVHLRPWEEHRAEIIRARKKEKRRRYKARKRLRLAAVASTQGGNDAEGRD